MANEKRLIDANKVINAMQRCLDEEPDKQGTVAYFAFESIIECLKQEPTVDAVEVKHGRWEDMWYGKYANPRYRCSVCKEKANYKNIQDELLTWHDVQALTPYCPYCVAKLDGGIDNDI
jgi:hypothetical protein